MGLPTLEYRRDRADVVQVYKLVHEIDKTSSHLLTRSQYTNTRGHRYKLYKPNARTNLRINVFGNRVIDKWNGLPEAVVEAPSLNSFKARLNRHWTRDNKFRLTVHAASDRTIRRG